MQRHFIDCSFALLSGSMRHLCSSMPKAVRLSLRISNAILVEHGERRFALRRRRAGAHHHLLDDAKISSGAEESPVQLRKFELAIGPLVFIAEALHDLEVFV